MINIFGGNTPVTKESIATKAIGALGMFNEAVAKLDESNNEAEVLKLQNQTVMDELAAENAELDIITTKNTKIVDNIKKLISA